MRIFIAFLCIMCALILGSEGNPLWIDFIALIICSGCLYYWIKIDPRH